MTRTLRVIVGLALTLLTAIPTAAFVFRGGPPVPQVGVYGGTAQSNIVNFNNWLGKTAQYTVVFFNQASRTAFNNDVPFEISQFASYSNTIIWSFPLITASGGETNALAASGSYDSSWTSALTQLVASRTADTVIWIRPNWEMNGSFTPWYCNSDITSYVASWQRFVNMARAISTKFRFRWDVNQGQDPPEPCYPGNAYVDAIGMDFYYDTQFYTNGGAATFTLFKTQPTGFDWMYGFSARTGKPFSAPEWGVNTDAQGAIYINLLAAEFRTKGWSGQAYFNAIQWELTNNQYPLAGAAYRAQFGVN